MEELFIKCPSCETVLGIKNSKNERVKRIVCPKCKQQMAINFEDDVKQSVANVSLQIVRMADGGSKCIVKSLNANDAVSINGETLHKDDELVLVEGDRLDIGDVTLFYNNSNVQPAAIQPVKQEETPAAPASKSSSNNWLYYVVCVVAFFIAAFLLWPKSKATKEVKSENTVALVDKQGTTKETDNSGKTKVKEIKGKSKDDNKAGVVPENKPLSDYELENKALKGDTNAQLELGKRLIRKPQSNNVIRGLNYLKLASRGGSAEAGHVWQQTVNKLIARNDSASIYILMSIDE